MGANRRPCLRHVFQRVKAVRPHFPNDSTGCVTVAVSRLRRQGGDAAAGPDGSDLARQARSRSARTALACSANQCASCLSQLGRYRCSCVGLHRRVQIHQYRSATRRDTVPTWPGVKTWHRTSLQTLSSPEREFSVQRAHKRPRLRQCTAPVPAAREPPTYYPGGGSWTPIGGHADKVQWAFPRMSRHMGNYHTNFEKALSGADDGICRRP